MSNFNTIDEAREYRAELEAIKALQAEIIGQQEQLEELAKTSGQLATNLEATNKAWNESPSSEEFEKFKAEWAASRD